MNVRQSTQSVLSRLVHRQYFWAILAIIALILVNLIKDPTYLSTSLDPDTGHLVGNLIDILRASAPIIMIAAGMSLVIATAGIDLSVGSVMAVSGAVCMQFLSVIGNSSSVGVGLAAVGLALALSTVIGVFNGILVSSVKLQPFITTLITMMAGRGIAKVITGGQNTAAQSTPVHWISNGYVVGLPVVFLLAIVLVVVLSLVIRRSALGMMIEAIGINPKASRMAGIKPRGLLIAVYTLSALMAGVAGIFSTATVMTVDVSQTGYMMELDAILAVVIGGATLAGGRFSIGGSVVGAILIATLNKTVLFLGVSSSATPAFKAAVIVILVLLQSDRIRALFARRRRRKAPEATKKEALV